VSSLLPYFIPLFVAIDPIGLLPVFLSLTDGMDRRRRRRVTFEAVSTALVVSLGFMLLGKAVFGYLGITPADFRIAGGVVLLVFAVYDLLITGKPAVEARASPGVFPLALPLIAGPATLTTTLVLADRSYAATALSLAANLAIVLAVLLSAGRVTRVVGTNALSAFSKIVVLLLAAIAVNLIRTGVADAWVEMAHR
jgi:multiple antibiotic resistance protein